MDQCKIFPLINFDILKIFAQNIDCGYTYTQFMFFGLKRKLGMPR